MGCGGGEGSKACRGVGAEVGCGVGRLEDDGGGVIIYYRISFGVVVKGWRGGRIEV